MTDGWVSKAPKLARWARENEGTGRSYKDPFDEKASYPSVTTVLKLVDKSGLVGWAAMKVAEKARDRTDIVMGDPDKVVQRLQYAHNEYRDDRAWLGSRMHAYVQEDHTGGWDYPALEGEELEVLESWNQFNDAYDVEPILTEFTVYNRTDGWAGTVDGLWRITDRLTGESWTAMVDLKTSNKTWPEHHKQLAALKNGECYMQEVPEGTEGAGMVKYTEEIDGKKKTLKSWWIEKPMPEFDKVQIVHVKAGHWDLIDVENLELHYESFMNYRREVATQEKINAAEKERGK